MKTFKETIKRNDDLTNLLKYIEYNGWDIIWNHTTNDTKGKNIVDRIFDRFPQYTTIDSFKAKLNRIFKKLTSKKILDKIKILTKDNPEDRIVINLTKSNVKMIMKFNLNKKNIIFATILSKEMQSRSTDIVVDIREAKLFGFNDIINEIQSCINEEVQFSCGKKDFYIEYCTNELLGFIDVSENVIEIDE